MHRQFYRQTADDLFFFFLKMQLSPFLYVRKMYRGNNYVYSTFVTLRVHLRRYKRKNLYNRAIHIYIHVKWIWNDKCAMPQTALILCIKL